MRAQYPVQGAVSIWIGTFSNENEMDRCTDDLIEPSLRISPALSDICEAAFEAQPVSVRNLLEGFSGWESFLDEACEVAVLNGMDTASGALVCYQLRCDAKPKHWPGILYLGTFRGQDASSRPDGE